MMHWTPFGRVGSEVSALPSTRLGQRAQDAPAEDSFARSLDALRSDGGVATADAAPAELEPSLPAPHAEAPSGDESAAQSPSEGEGVRAPQASTEAARGLEEDARGFELAAPRTAHAPVEGPQEARAVTTGTALHSATIAPQRVAPKPRASGAVLAVAPRGAAPLPTASVQGTSHAVESTKGAASVRGARRSPAPGSEWTQRLHDGVLKKIALAATEQGGEMRVLLEPQRLGSVAVRLQLEGRALRLEIKAESIEAAQALERDSARLVDELAALGLDVEDVDIETSSRDEQRAGHELFERETNQRREDGTTLAKHDARDEADVVAHGDGVGQDHSSPVDPLQPSIDTLV